MLAHMVSKFVILFLFKVGIALHFAFCIFNFEFLQNMFYDGGIVEEAVDVCSNAMVGLHDGLVGVADALMYLIALACLSVELEADLPRGLLGRHRSADGQESKSWQAADATLNAIGVVDRLPQHLVASADPYYHLPIAMGADNGLGSTVATQFQQVVEGCLRAWQDDDVGSLQVRGVVRIEKVDTRVALQDVEVREV